MGYSNRPEVIAKICQQLGVSQYARFTVNQACDSLGVSASTLHRLRNRGAIGHLKIGKRVEFFGHHLAEFLLNVEQEPTCQNTTIKNEHILLENTGYQDGFPKAPHGKSRSITKPLPRQSAARLAKQTFQKQS